MLVDIIQSAILEFDGKKYENLSSCPYCRGPVTGYDYKKKHFATVIEGDKTRNIEVHVKRFQCLKCGRVSCADAPFYPDTRLGKLVVDLCIALSEKMPYHRTARVLRHMGLAVDRGSVRNYANKKIAPVPCTDIFGFRIPLSVISLSIPGLGG